jgi:hypothetical protein
MFIRWRHSLQGKSGAADAKALRRELEQRIDTATHARIRNMAETCQALGDGWQQRLEDDAAFVIDAATIRHALRNARQYAIVPEVAGLRVQVSSLFLRDAHRYLTGDPHGRERLALVSGTISDDGVRIFSRRLDVAMEEASPAYVRAAPGETHKAIVDLVERDGHPLHAMWHSHMMRGADSTRASAVDLANQERFCAMGWDDVLGGICSLDGYFRLYSTARDFSVSVYGNGAELVADAPRETILKLTRAD